MRFMSQEWKLKNGRARTIETKDELEERLTEYFVKENKPFTLRSMALHLGLSSMQTLSNWYKVPEFKESLEQARLICENYAESELYSAERKNYQGIIFSMKNNYGWMEKTEVISTNTNKNTNVNLNKNVDEMTDEELQAELEQLEAELKSDK